MVVSRQQHGPIPQRLATKSCLDEALPIFGDHARRCYAGKRDAEYFVGICALFEQSNYAALYANVFPVPGPAITRRFFAEFPAILNVAVTPGASSMTIRTLLPCQPWKRTPPPVRELRDVNSHQAEEWAERISGQRDSK